ncbi:hypothetical protein GCM10010124_13480 [Pilimelia terevasa]|uniref:NodB homology domain-containing protein n=1 Tax=Pilimelia terevasa TaxID=53372 RepID=A0A8J3BL24_9ACTN|nr:polysaccharide deacetylase family protein [Pilimelia terevasa]GGK22313.1 hypothetical protein GCM10010124_13480 [Pilimelia terevasa]
MSRRVRRQNDTRPARRSVVRSVAELGVTAAALAVAAVLLVRPATTVDAAPAASPATTPRLDPPASALANPCTRGQVALTFDDGPGPYTGPVLAVLRAYQAQATFFVLGEKARADATTVRAMVADGHTVGNHSWDHPHLADLDAAVVRDQLVRTQEAITAAGAPAPVLVRPPFGSGGRTVDTVANELGLRPSSWTFDSEDWRGRRPADLANAVVQNAQPGMSVLLHDGTADAQNTVEALPAIIEGLRSRGYCTAALR